MTIQALLLLMHLASVACESATSDVTDSNHTIAAIPPHTEPVYAVVWPWFVVGLGIVVYYIKTRHFRVLPYTCDLFILGMCMGIGAAKTEFDDQLTESIEQWRSINHEVLFLVFLPGLLFKDALEVDFHLFQASLPQLLVLAFPMVLVGTLLTACAAYYIFPYDWSFHLALTFGAILSATDPVAVSSLLNEVGAPPRLKMHIAGESLLNDGSAVVFYTVFSMLFLDELNIHGLGEDLSIGQGVAIFFRMALGGACVGLAYAMVLIVLLFHLDWHYEKEEIVLQVASTITISYLSFYTSEIACSMSGVIATVVCGIVTKAFGGGLISDWQVMDSFWSLLEHLLNTVIFALGGIQFGFIIGGPHRDWDASDWGNLLAIYFLANRIRFFSLAFFYPLNSRIGLKTNWKESFFSGWAGLRGAVGIALALGLDNEVGAETENPQDQVLTTQVFGMVGGMAFLTLLINGGLSGRLLSKLGLAESTDSRKQIVIKAKETARSHLLDDFLHLMTDPRFFFVDFALVMQHCPELKGITALELEDALKQNRKTVHPDLYKQPELTHVLPYIPDSVHLRASLEKQSRRLFMDSSQMKRIQSFDALEEGLDEVENEPDPLLVKDIRLMFVELLRASYQGQIRDGALDPREFNGFLAYALLQSLDFAHDAADQPLDDWILSQLASTDLVSSGLVNRSGEFIKRMYGSCCVRGTKTLPQTDALRDTRSLQYQQLRLDVLRAFAFIDAHEEAQDRLGDEFGEKAGDTASAFRLVMAESDAQVSKAKDVLKRKNKKQLQHVISHHLCILLQNKLARFIKMLSDSGILLPREARHFLEKVDTSIKDIRTCNVEEHEGTIEFEEPQEFARSRRTRKRIKQKSIL